jgi:hypothetical protein
MTATTYSTSSRAAHHAQGAPHIAGTAGFSFELLLLQW